MAGKRLGPEERRVIENCLVQGFTQLQIARVLGRSPSTVCRELARNHNGWHGPSSPLRLTARARQRDAYRHCYRADAAQRRAAARARRPKARRLDDPRLWQAVAGLLRRDWSPQQIAAMLPAMFPDEPAMRASHETIYRTLFVQSRGALKRELCAYLRTQRLRRGARSAQPRGLGGGSISGELSIRERPAEAEDRAVPGHWEGICCGELGSRPQIATLVERHSRYVMLVKLPDKNSIRVADLLARHIQRLPKEIVRSITWDRGIEMASHAPFTVATDVQVYFCDPQSPWQRGSNENTNGLLRQYFPKGDDLTALTQDDCDEVAHRLNTRPRHTLGWQTPNQALLTTLNATTG